MDRSPPATEDSARSPELYPCLAPVWVPEGRLDGSMNTNPNNSGDPAIVPSLESVEKCRYRLVLARGGGGPVRA
jgi:hypothetical protein